MEQRGRLFGFLLLGSLVASSCAPAGSITSARGEAGSASPGLKRTLVMISPGELPTYSDKEMLPSGVAVTVRTRGKELLNAKLALRDERGLPFPVLAESLPELNTPSWRVFADGQMETTYPLRPNLTWHDGQPLSAQDFVFAARVYATPDFGVVRGSFRFVQEVAAPDPRTVVIRWNQPYPDAVEDVGVLPPLPRHILEQPYQGLEPDPFLGLPFWRENYVGAGAFKLEHREPGAFFEVSAFDGFALGRPKIDRIRVTYVPDTNVGIATLLSGEAQFYMEGSLYGEDGLIIQQQWGATGGIVLYEPVSPRAIGMQMRPEFAVPRQLASDGRVRRALAYAIDREALVEAVTAGQGLLRDVYTHPKADYYDVVAQAVAVRYRHDPRRAQQLLEEAGFTRGSGGSWITPDAERFTLEHWYIQGGNNERESTILLDGLRRFGIDPTLHQWGVLRTSAEERAKTSGMFAGSIRLDQFHSNDIARPETRWRGSNRYGYSNPEVDRLTDAYNTTIDRSERIQVIAHLERILMEDLPALPLYYNPRVIAYAAGLKGVAPKLVDEGGVERGIWEWQWN